MDTKECQRCFQILPNTKFFARSATCKDCLKLKRNTPNLIRCPSCGRKDTLDYFDGKKICRGCMIRAQRKNEELDRLEAERFQKHQEKKKKAVEKPEKTCRRCKTTHPKYLFPVRSASLDGRSSYCIYCTHVYKANAQNQQIPHPWKLHTTSERTLLLYKSDFELNHLKSRVHHLSKAYDISNKSIMYLHFMLHHVGITTLQADNADTLILKFNDLRENLL